MPDQTDQIVTVSLLHPMRYRNAAAGVEVAYAPGMRQMPLSHATGLGLLHRIVGGVPQEEPEHKRAPFEGKFDDRLTVALMKAGYDNLDQLAKATDDEIRAIGGVGPATIERILRATGRL